MINRSIRQIPFRALFALLAALLFPIGCGFDMKVAETLDPGGDPINPVAMIQTAERVNVRENVSLDGTGSYDPKGEPLSYEWTLTERPFNSNAELEPASVEAAATSFFADRSGYYTVTLRVTNASELSGDEAVRIEATGITDPRTPVAIIDAAQRVGVKSNVTLDGSRSYDERDESLKYEWALAEIPHGSSAELADPETAVTTFFADKGGYYTATLTVTNASDVASEVATARIDVVATGDNHPPVAIINATVSGGVAILDGSESYDIDGVPVTHTWEIVSVSGGSVTLTFPNSPVATLGSANAVDVVVKLLVSDGVDNDEEFVSLQLNSSDSGVVGDVVEQGPTRRTNR